MKVGPRVHAMSVAITTSLEEILYCTYMHLKQLKFNYVYVYMYVTFQWYKVAHNDWSAGLRKTSSFTCIHRKSSESPTAVIYVVSYIKVKAMLKGILEMLIQ